MLWPGTHAVSAVFDNCFYDTLPKPLQQQHRCQRGSRVLLGPFSCSASSATRVHNYEGYAETTRSPQPALAKALIYTWSLAPN